MKAFLDNALSPAGVLIHDVVFKMTVDLKTGFYIAKYMRVDSPTAIVNKRIFDVEKEDGSSNIIPFEYPVYMKKRLHGLLSASTRAASEEAISWVLARFKASYNKLYVFDKGKSSLKFKLDTAFPYSDKVVLPNKTRKYTGRKSYTHTHTRKVKRPKV